MSKDVEIKARVTRAQKETLQALADERGEGLSIILREAVREYLARRRPGEKAAPARQRRGGPVAVAAAEPKGEPSAFPQDSSYTLNEDAPSEIQPIIPARAPAAPRPITKARAALREMGRREKGKS